MTDPLTEPVPAFAPDVLAELLASTYQRAGELTPLHGERDLNFLVTEPDGTRSILKLHNPADTPDVVGMHVAALAHINRVAPDLPVGHVIPTVDGHAWTHWTGRDGRSSCVRMLSFLGGHHPDLEELDEAALFRWGAMSASLGRALRGFFHPAAGYPIQWDIRRILGLRAWTEALSDDDQAMVTAFMDRYRDRVDPMIPGLRAQIVHNDLSRENVLVDDDLTVSGVTDFGDMTHTALVCDLAVAVADVLAGRPGWSELAPAMLAGYQSVTPLEPVEIDLLADLVAARLAAGLTIHTWRFRDSELPGDSPAARAMLAEMLDAGIDQIARRWAAALSAPHSGPSALPYRPVHTAELLHRRAQVLGPLSLSYRRPLHLAAGAGPYLYDSDGVRYLDAYNNVPVLGHVHPAVTAAVTAQLARLNTNSRYLHEAGVELAETLIASMPGGRLDRVLLVNSGSEANDLAWRIARFATGNTGGVVTHFAYHGVTTVTTDLSPETWGDDPPPAHVRLVDPPGRAGSGSGLDVEAAGAELAAEGSGLAAVFVDGVFTSDGILGPAPDWTRAAAKSVRAAGGLYVADEVQAGYGRTGDHLWSWAADGLDPDLVTLGKPMGNGYPVAAVVGPADLIDPFVEHTEYFSTYGGNTAACVAALAVLRAIAAEGIVEHAHDVGHHLLSGLTDVANRHDRVASPRGWGLAIGIDVRGDAGGLDPAAAEALVDGMRDRGVLIGRTGATDATLKIRPPLVITREDGDRIIDALDDALAR